MLGIGDVAVPRQLVALVAVLAAALTVALTGDRRDAATGLAELARCKSEVDRRDDVVDALGVLLDTAGVEEHPRGCGAPPLRRLLDPRRRDARDPGGPIRRHLGDGRGSLVEANGVVVDEVVIEPVVADHLVEHGPEQRRVGAGADTEEQISRAGQRHDPRILDDQLGAPVAGLPDVARRDRERLGDVGPGDPNDVGEGDVAPRIGTAVDAEGLLVPGPGRHHAVAAVVVEVGRLQGEAGELADQVALLVRQRDARQHREGVVAVRRLDPADLTDDPIEGVVPGDPAEPAGRRRVAFHRVQQPVGVAALEVALDALRAQHAPVERELVPRLEADHGVVVDLQLDPALLAAEAAVRVDDSVDVESGIPSAWRGLVEVRPEAGDQLLLGDRWAGHQPNPPTRADWARVSWARRQRGQVSW